MHLLKKSLLTFALASTHVFTPAQATTYVNLGNIAPGIDQSLWGTVFGSNPAKGNFDVIYKFTVSNVFALYDITASAISSTSSIHGYGSTFTAIALEDSIGNVLELGEVSLDAHGHSIAALPDYFFIGNGNYRLELQGVSSGEAANYGGTISLPPIPETEAWTMLLLGLPMLSLAARRRQA